MTLNQLSNLLSSTLDKRLDLLPADERLLMKKRIQMFLTHAASSSTAIEKRDCPMHELPVDEYRRFNGTIDSILDQARHRAVQAGREKILMDDIIHTMDEMQSAWPFRP